MEAGGWDDYQTFLNCYTMTTPAKVASIMNSPLRLAKDGTLKEPAQVLEPSAGKDVPDRNAAQKNTPARGALRLVS